MLRIEVVQENKENYSNDDLQLTNRLEEAGKILGIEVLDHIIFADESFYSFKSNKVLYIGGWGGRIRTLAPGARVLCPTTRRLPNSFY